MLEIEAIKNRYFDQLINSIHGGTPIDFPIAEFCERDFLLYIDKVSEMLTEYKQIKSLYGKNAVELVKFILQHLKKYKDHIETMESYEIMKKLFYGLEFQNLIPSLQQNFEEGIRILEKTINYFCSTPQKDYPEINASYEQTVTNVFGINKMLQLEDWKKTNYVAKLIVRYLNNHGFNNYFFDQDQIVNGDLIEEKVFDYCGRTVVLVILAQQETFRDIRTERNWCFEEYKHYKKTHNQTQFIVYKIPSLARPTNARQEIKDWFDYIATTGGISSTTIEQNWTHDMIRTKINADAEKITDAYESFFLNFISNIT